MCEVPLPRSHPTLLLYFHSSWTECEHGFPRIEAIHSVLAFHKMWYVDKEPDFLRCRSGDGRGKSIYEGVGMNVHAGFWEQLCDFLSVL